MTTTMTEEQSKAVAEHPDEPLRLTDPRTKQVYVLLRHEVFERVKAVLGMDFHPRDAYAAIDRAFAPGWEDPKMDEYDRYDELKR